MLVVFHLGHMFALAALKSWKPSLIVGVGTSH